MSADRELLELAAKAVGFYVKNEVIDRSDFFIGFLIKPSVNAKRQSIAFWNPLTDDGDALRLAVQLQIELSFINGDTHADGQSEGGQDKLANTRRAIVRAAAEIGRAL